MSRVKPVRLTIVQTHPVQYLAPWFRHIAANCPEIDLRVVYASRPKPEQQGTGFDRAFEWDTFEVVYKESEQTERVTIHGKALRILKRQPDGSWKFASVMAVTDSRGNH